MNKFAGSCRFVTFTEEILNGKLHFFVKCVLKFLASLMPIKSFLNRKTRLSSDFLSWRIHQVSNQFGNESAKNGAGS